MTGEYGCWIGVKIRVAVVGQHGSVLKAFGSVGRERAVLEEDMWVHAAMRS